MAIAADNLPIVPLSDPQTWLNLRGSLLGVMNTSPVARAEDGTLWFLSHAAVSWTLKNRRFGAPNLATSYGGLDPAIVEWSSRLMGSLNGEDHKRTRGLMASAFTPRMAEELRPFMRSTLDALFAEYAVTGDLRKLGELPGRVMSQLLGVPPEDFERFASWVDDLSQFFRVDLANPAVSNRVVSAIGNLGGYIRELVAQREGSADSGDLLARLLAAYEGERLTKDEVVIMATNLLFAGTDTVRNSIEIFCYLFATHPDQLQVLKSDPDLIPLAVEELLRFEPVSPFHLRQALEDVEYEGVQITKGQIVMVSLITADRDPEVWESPEILDVRREGAPRTQIFGGGAHTCLGAAMARAELQEFLRALIARADRIDLSSAPAFEPFQLLRRLQNLELSIVGEPVK